MQSVRIRMMRIRVFLLLLIPFLISAAPQRQSPGQGTETRRSQGPVLIRDFEEPGEGEEKVYPHDPEQARDSVDRIWWAGLRRIPQTRNIAQ